jgi:membrane protease subunit HflC
MRLNLTGGAIAVILLLAVIVGYSTFFTVDQTNQAIVVRLGQPVRVITDPGLNVKMPFIDSVIYIDKRILNVEAQEQEVNVQSQDNSSSDEVGERLVVDAFARYRITDALKFYQSGGPSVATSLLRTYLSSALRQVLGAATLPDVVRNKREELMAQIRDQVERKAGTCGSDEGRLNSQPEKRCGLGIQVVDVRIRRADLPPPNSKAVYARMQAERQREAAEFRAQGSQKSQEIKAEADRDVTVIIADANQQSEQIRGEGDGERNSIFANAYGQDPGFFTFYRSMQAYERSFQKGDTNLVLRPDSDFFRYFGDPNGRAPLQAGAAPAASAHPDAHAAAPGPGRTDARAAVTTPAR